MLSTEPYVEEISLCSLEEIGALQAFIHEKWRKNHALAVSKPLMDFQHRTSSHYNFILARHPKTKEIHAILGFIPLAQYDTTLAGNKDLWLAIWKVDEQISSPGTGFRLLKTLEKIYSPTSIGAIGINANVKRIYDVLGYTTGVLQQYYMLNPNSTSYQIAKAPTPSLSNETNSSVTLKPISDLTTISPIDIIDHPNKSIDYIIQRYARHPVYHYHFYGAYLHDVLKAVFVVRKITIQESSCLRIIDVIGDYRQLDGISAAFLSVLITHQAEYIDCVNYGISEDIFQSWGFTLRTEDVIIPHHFDPFEQKNIDVQFAYKAPHDNYVIFKGDSDLDRPNTIQ